MSKSLEFWYALVLALTVVAYAAACFYYFNHGSDRLATRYFAYAVYAALLARFLVARLGGEEFGLMVPSLDLDQVHVIHIPEDWHNQAFWC